MELEHAQEKSLGRSISEDSKLCFLDFCDERYSILLKKEQGQPKPWTDDPVLQKYFFCNVYREDDRTTEWFRENIREPLRNDPRVFVATVAFRFFNRISTGELIKDTLLKSWDRDEVLKILEPAPPPLFTGAYMIPSRKGIKKINWVSSCIERISQDAELLLSKIKPGSTSIRGLWSVMRKYEGLGNFLAYEIVTDLRHTYLLESAPDIDTWAAPGPGCTRGLGWLVANSPNVYTETSMVDWPEMLSLMSGLLDFVNSHIGDPELTCMTEKWEMREVEHCLCEYDKYRRGQTDTGTMKRLYDGLPSSTSGNSRARRGTSNLSPAEQIDGFLD